MKTFKIGDKVKVFCKSYVRGTRRPGYAGRFTFRCIGEGVLLAKNDIRAWLHQPTWTQEDIDNHLNSGHVGLANATGQNDGSGLTEKNNPVLINCEVKWLDRDQIK